MAADDAFVEALPDAAARIAGQWLPSQADGLIGRNRTWGDLYSPRFQLGAGFALRIALSADHDDAARRAFAAVAVGVRDIAPDGRLPSRVPDDVAQGAQPGEADVASGAAFYLGDACLAVLALEASRSPDTIASTTERVALTDALGRATRWLTDNVALVERADALAPNRLLHDALALTACGLLTDDPDARTAGARLARLAQAQHDPSGHYIEGGGADTNYQAVAVEVGHELTLVSDADDAAALRAQLTDATAWLSARVTDDGRIDSTGNTRTCGACEVFLPGDPPKQVGPTHIVRSLAYGAHLLDQPEALAAAARFLAWIDTEPTTTCFERDAQNTLVPSECGD